MDHLSVAAKNVRIISNGFDSTRFNILDKGIKNAVLNDLVIKSTNVPLITFVSKFTEFKGIDVLLKAAVSYEREMKGIKTLLIGSGELWNEMHELANNLGLTGTLFMGQVPQSKLARIYNASDLFVLPSRFEPFGLAALEAMACGTPVVVTNQGGFPDFVDCNVGALVPVNNVSALSNAIVTEIRNDAKLNKGFYASKFAHNNFTWESKVKELVHIYENVLTKEHN